MLPDEFLDKLELNITITTPFLSFFFLLSSPLQDKAMKNKTGLR